MYRLRLFAKLKAHLLGYFWLPCPVCGEYYAGFEHGKHSWPITFERGRLVCSKVLCQEKALEEIARFYNKNEYT